MSSLEKTINEFARNIQLDSTITSEIDSLSKIVDLNKEIDKINARIKKHLKVIKKEMRKGSGKIEHEGNLPFKETFAHHKCYLLLDGMLDAHRLDSDLGVESIVLLDENKNAVHYLCEITYNNETYYADAYGYFKDLQDITDRYKTTSISEKRYFDTNDDSDPLFTVYRDNQSELADEIEECLEGVIEDLDMGVAFDYFDYYVKSQAFNVISSCSNEINLDKSGLSL